MIVAADYVTALVAAAPPPTAEQITTLRTLLGPALAAGRPEPRCRPRPIRPRPARPTRQADR